MHNISSDSTSNTKLDKTNFEKLLFNGETYKEAMAKFDQRFHYILQVLAGALKWNIPWFDYCNDANRLETLIEILQVNDLTFVCARQPSNSGFTKYNHSFPVAWFYSDFEDGLKEEIRQFEENLRLAVEQETQRELSAEQEADALIAEIFSRFTPEEQVYFSQLETKEVLARKALLAALPKTLVEKLTPTDLFFVGLASNKQKLQNVKKLPVPKRVEFYKQNGQANNTKD